MFDAFKTSVIKQMEGWGRKDGTVGLKNRRFLFWENFLVVQHVLNGGLVRHRHHPGDDLKKAFKEPERTACRVLPGRARHTEKLKPHDKPQMVGTGAKRSLGTG